MPGRARLACAAALACMAVGVTAVCVTAGALPAYAADGPVAWPTFFRLGPGKQYTVVSELPRGTVLDVIGCGDGWCQARLGRVVGYVDRAALLPGELAASRAGDGQPCFGSRRAGYGTGETFRYCPR